MKIKSLFLALCILLFLGIILYPSDIPRDQKSLLCQEIKDAKSIELCLIATEKSPSDSHKILARLNLSKKGRNDIENIFSRQVFFQSWCGFTVFGYKASHMILIHRLDGTTNSLVLSFPCLKIRFDDGQVYYLPPAWSFSLKDFFLQAGIPLRPELFEKFSADAPVLRTGSVGGL